MNKFLLLKSKHDLTSFSFLTKEFQAFSDRKILWLYLPFILSSRLLKVSLLERLLGDRYDPLYLCFRLAFSFIRACVDYYKPSEAELLLKGIKKDEGPRAFNDLKVGSSLLLFMPWVWIPFEAV